MTALPRATVALSGAGMLNTGPGEGSFLATSEADLRRGTLRASAETSTTGRGVTLATADATFGDFLFFDNTSTITVTLQLAVHGAFDGLGPVAGEVNAGLRLGGERLEARLRWNTDLGGLPTQGVRLLPVAGGTSATRQVALRSTLPANTLALLSLTGDIEPGWMLSVDSWMAVSARAGTNAIASASFGNTAQLSLLVPEGVTVRSVSGHFLAEPLAPVPEPATGAMLAAGLVLLQLVQRTRRRFIVPTIAAAMLPALLLAGAAPASAQMAHAGVWNSSNFNNPFPAGNARSETVTSGRANVGHSATTSPFSDRVAWVAGASADLRRGSVGVEIQADRSGNPASTQGDTVWALGELNETLTFSGTRPGLVDFAAGISGSFQSIDGSAFQADGFLFAGGLSGQLDFHWVNNLSSPSVSVFASPGTTGIRNEPGGLFGTMHLLRLVQPGETLALQLRLQLRVGPGAYDHAVANFGHTAQLGITLPEGMSFTSASGDFMVDAPPLPVPEPAAAALLLAGLGLLRARHLAGVAVSRGRRHPRLHRRACASVLAAWSLVVVPLQARAVDVSLKIGADTGLVQPGQPLTTHTTASNFQSGPLYPQPWVTSRLDGTLVRAQARQAVNGWFDVHAEADLDWGQTGGRYAAWARTEALIGVATQQVDTPLALDFVVQGSTVGAASWYGVGEIAATAGMDIQTSLNFGPWQTLWSLHDTVRIAATAQHGVQQVDLQGVGAPAIVSQAWGWQDMQVRGEVRRGLFQGHLDLGLLQPGEVLSIRYVGWAEVDADPRYGGSARAWLEDPFAVRAAPPLLRIAGVDLPTLDMPAVPEPASALLLCVGLAALLAARWRPPHSTCRRDGVRRSGPVGALRVGVAGAPAQAELVLDALRISGLSVIGTVHDAAHWQLGQGQPVVTGSQQGDHRD